MDPDFTHAGGVSDSTRGTLAGKQFFCNISSDLLVSDERAALCAVGSFEALRFHTLKKKKVWEEGVRKCRSQDGR